MGFKALRIIIFLSHPWLLLGVWGPIQMLVLLGCFIRANLTLELELMPTFVLQIQILRCRQGVVHILTLRDFAHRKTYRFTENKPQTLMSKPYQHWLWATAFFSSSPLFLPLLPPCFSQSISLVFPSHCSVGLSEDCNLWRKLTSSMCYFPYAQSQDRKEINPAPCRLSRTQRSGVLQWRSLSTSLPRCSMAECGLPFFSADTQINPVASSSDINVFSTHLL